MRGPAAWGEADPFELPEWLGTGEVTWVAVEALTHAARVTGRLEGAGEWLECDLLAVDEACPTPVASEDLRTLAHQTWRRGEVLLVDLAGRRTLAVPGRRFSADLALATLERLARAVGASPAAYSVRLVVGRDSSGAPDIVGPDMPGTAESHSLPW